MVVFCCFICNFSSLSLSGDVVLCWLHFSCPFLSPIYFPCCFSPAFSFFCLLSLLFFPAFSFFCLFSLLFFSGRVPRLGWFDSVYAVTTTGFVADQLIMLHTTNNNYHCNNNTTLINVQSYESEDPFSLLK